MNMKTEKRLYFSLLTLDKMLEILDLGYKEQQEFLDNILDVVKNRRTVKLCLYTDGLILGSLYFCLSAL